MERCELCRCAALLLAFCYRLQLCGLPKYDDRNWIRQKRPFDRSKGSYRNQILNVALLGHFILIAALTVLIIWLTSYLPVCWRWIVALVYVLFIGPLGTAVFICVLRRCHMRQRESDAGVPGSFMGVFERLLFLGLVWGLASVLGSLNEGGAAAVGAAMAFWLGTKLLSGWNRETKDEPQEQSDKRARGAMSALMAGTLNMVFATVAGLMASGDLVLR